MVRGATAEIAKLTGPEPEEVFEAIRSRILQDDNLKAKPKGSDGLIAWSKHIRHYSAVSRLHPRVAVAKIGGWAASSWGTCFPDAGIAAEFQAIQRGWAEQTENGPLQRATLAILKLPQS